MVACWPWSLGAPGQLPIWLIRPCLWPPLPFLPHSEDSTPASWPLKVIADDTQSVQVQYDHQEVLDGEENQHLVENIKADHDDEPDDQKGPVLEEQALSYGPDVRASSVQDTHVLALSLRLRFGVHHCGDGHRSRADSPTQNTHTHIAAYTLCCVHALLTRMTEIIRYVLFCDENSQNSVFLWKIMRMKVFHCLINRTIRQCFSDCGYWLCMICTLLDAFVWLRGHLSETILFRFLIFNTLTDSFREDKGWGYCY